MRKTKKNPGEKIVMQFAITIYLAAVFPCIFEQLCLTGILMRALA